MAQLVPLHLGDDDNNRAKEKQRLSTGRKKSDGGSGELEFEYAPGVSLAALVREEDDDLAAALARGGRTGRWIPLYNPGCPGDGDDGGDGGDGGGDGGGGSAAAAAAGDGKKDASEDGDEGEDAAANVAMVGVCTS
jgi:hypothetical protein